MTERSRFWGGTVTGDAAGVAPYDAETEFAGVLRSLAGAGAIATNLSGVFRNELDQLRVSGSGTPVSVAAGRALVYGTWYEADAAVSVAVPTPSVSTRIDRIVLRKDWAAQTVRVTRIGGVEGGGAPAMTQVAGTTWDMPLATLSVTTGGGITVTDGREFIGDRAIIEIVKAADEIVNNSAVLQNDNDFSFPVKAGDIWFVEMRLLVEQANGTPSIKVGWTGVSVNGWQSAIAVNDTSVVRMAQGNTVTSQDLNTYLSGMWIVEYKTVLTVTADGTAQFVWAQMVATGANTEINQHSTMRAVRKQ